MAQEIAGKTYDEVAALASVQVPALIADADANARAVRAAAKAIVEYFNLNGEKGHTGNPAELVITTGGYHLKIWDTNVHAYVSVPVPKTLPTALPVYAGAGGPVTAFTLQLEDDAKDTITAGHTSQLVVGSKTPGNGVLSILQWESDDEAVVKVRQGKIFAKGAGTATVTATDLDSGVKATFDFTVEAVAGYTPVLKDGLVGGVGISADGTTYVPERATPDAPIGTATKESALTDIKGLPTGEAEDYLIENPEGLLVGRTTADFLGTTGTAHTTTSTSGATDLAAYPGGADNGSMAGVAPGTPVTGSPGAPDLANDGGAGTVADKTVAGGGTVTPPVVTPPTLTDVAVAAADLSSSISGAEGSGAVDTSGITITGVKTIVADTTSGLSNSDQVTFTLTPEDGYSINGAVDSSGNGIPADVVVTVAGLV